MLILLHTSFYANTTEILLTRLILVGFFIEENMLGKLNLLQELQHL